jgi:hypothetical protein
VHEEGANLAHALERAGDEGRELGERVDRFFWQGDDGARVSVLGEDGLDEGALGAEVRKRVTSLTPASLAMSRVVAPRKPCIA